DEAQRLGTLLHIATHDPRLVDRLNAFIVERGVPTSAYEYAMLYGIQRALQLRLAREGRRIRVLIAYGEYWFAWHMRRLADRAAPLRMRARCASDSWGPRSETVSRRSPACLAIRALITRAPRRAAFGNRPTEARPSRRSSTRNR